MLTIKNAGLAIVLLTHLYILGMGKGMDKKQAMYHSLINLAALGMIMYKK